MINAMKIVGGLLLGLSLHGCATYKPVPEGYTGPVAVVADSGTPGDGRKSVIFAMMDVDGQAISTSFGASASASYGQGASLTTRFIARPVPAKPMKVRLKGSHITGAPIHAMASQIAGTFFSVEGVVDFTPVAGGSYVVKGELKKGASSVWIEDRATGLPVTEKIVEK
ncbi:hypothetical protein [Polaromonas sp. A23]|uniref:hypothetical protein n=1 Tax=Polaromonas sp. A23 TaxID=1944133 RepID=UPI001115974C|nr:hypothetical protein [Polaromonas sp. A23]